VHVGAVAGKRRVTGPDPAAALGRDTAAHWDGLYRAGGEIWGGTPSELVAVAVERLRTRGPAAANLTLLDLGCGYGRDAVALWHALGLAIVGVDGAARCAGAGRPRFDAVYCSNVYQLLGPAERAALRVTVRDQLAPGGLFFLSTLSTRDPQHAGKGRPVRGEPGSFVERTYLHLCHRAELAGDFDFLRLERLDEIAYREERLAGAPHDHVSWVVVGRAS
jgi:SAM-dependent methyltransferase